MQCRKSIFKDQQGRQSTCKLNIEARSRNHSCRGKAISITYSQRVSLALFIQYAKHMCRVILSTVACLAVSNVSSLSYKRYALKKNLLNLKWVYTGCPWRNVPEFGRVFLMLKYIDITQNTYVQSGTVTEIMAREVWNFDSCYSLIDYQIHIETGRNMWFL